VPGKDLPSAAASSGDIDPVPRQDLAAAAASAIIEGVIDHFFPGLAVSPVQDGITKYMPDSSLILPSSPYCGIAPPIIITEPNLDWFYLFSFLYLPKTNNPLIAYEPIHVMPGCGYVLNYQEFCENSIALAWHLIFYFWLPRQN
jgi:hypothetical protein